MKSRVRRYRRWLRRGLLLAVLLFGGLIAAGPPLIDAVGGAFDREPEQLASGLSAGARRLIDRAFAGLDPAALVDHHVHVVGLGSGGTGNRVHPAMRSWRHPLRHLRFMVYASAAGITDLKRADQQYADRLLRLIDGFPGGGRFGLLAFDHNHRHDGAVNDEESEFHTTNAYVLALAARRPGRLVPVVSVNPYRPDALAALRRWARRGARWVKWLPNAMGIDPADPRIDPFYRLLARLDLTLLTHAGEEKAVEAEEAQLLGNPLRLRRPLDLGVRVVVAHCASLGQNPDLDRPDRPLVDNFDLFIRLMDEPRYRGLLFGEISATTQFNRLGKPLLTLLARRDLHPRLVNGSDYPLPAINVIVRTGALLDHGLIDETERGLLNEIYRYNPLLFDFVVKRTIRHPETGKGFDAVVFTGRAGFGSGQAAFGRGQAAGAVDEATEGR